MGEIYLSEKLFALIPSGPYIALLTFTVQVKSDIHRLSGRKCARRLHSFIILVYRRRRLRIAKELGYCGHADVS